MTDDESIDLVARSLVAMPGALRAYIKERPKIIAERDRLRKELAHLRSLVDDAIKNKVEQLTGEALPGCSCGTPSPGLHDVACPEYDGETVRADLARQMCNVISNAKQAPALWDRGQKALVDLQEQYDAVKS